MGSPFGSRKINNYCAFCRSPHWHYRHRNLGVLHIGISLISSVLISLYAFGELDTRLTLFFVVGLFISEIFTQVRWRLALACRQCGFDPVIYKKNPADAVKIVKAHLDRRQHSSMALRPLKLPVLSSHRAQALQKTENQPRLSKQI